MNTRVFTFAGGETGVWRVVAMNAVAGAPLPGIPRLNVAAGSVSPQPPGTKWLLRGITSNERYVVREEKDRLVAKQPSLGRAEATCAARSLSGKTPHGGDCLKTNAGRFLRNSPVTFTSGSNISLLWPAASTIVGTWARTNPSTS